MTCEQCGKPVHPMRALCDFCGAEAPAMQPSSLGQAVARTRDVATNTWAQARGVHLSLPRRPRSLLAARPSRVLAVLACTGLAAAVVLLVVTRSSAGSDTDTARAAAETNVARQAELQAAFDTAQQRLRDIEATQGRAQAAAEARVATAEGEVNRLRDQVTKAEASAKAEKEAVERIGRRVQALTECLNGTNVALQFGRTDAWDPADRALAAVSAACADARSLR